MLWRETQRKEVVSGQRPRYEFNIKVGLKEMGCVGMEWIHEALDNDTCWTYM
jgi:hypothetical protein